MSNIDDLFDKNYAERMREQTDEDFSDQDWGALSGRLDAAENKLDLLHQQLEELEGELGQDITDIDAKWMATAKVIVTEPISLERTDVKVTQLNLVWIPVP